MERLSDKAIEVANRLQKEKIIIHEAEYVPLIDCANKLSKYEDSELEPEEFKNIKELSKRLDILEKKLGITISKEK